MSKYFCVDVDSVLMVCSVEVLQYKLTHVESDYQSFVNDRRQKCKRFKHRTE